MQPQTCKGSIVISVGGTFVATVAAESMFTITAIVHTVTSGGLNRHMSKFG